MINILIYKIKDEINNNNYSLIKKTAESYKISSLAWKIVNKNDYNDIIDIFHQVIKFVYDEKKIKTVISEFDLFHCHIILNSKNEIELLFHLFEYPKNIGLLSLKAKKSNLVVNKQDFMHRNVIYNCSNKTFRFSYNYLSHKYATVDASSIGFWIGDIYLDDKYYEPHIFLLSKFLEMR